MQLKWSMILSFPISCICFMHYGDLYTYTTQQKTEKLLNCECVSWKDDKWRHRVLGSAERRRPRAARAERMKLWDKKCYYEADEWLMSGPATQQYKLGQHRPTKYPTNRNEKKSKFPYLWFKLSNSTTTKSLKYRMRIRIQKS